MKRIRVELNLNLTCQLACENCNRGFKEFGNRPEQTTTLEQVREFVNQARSAKNAGRFFVVRGKIVGGEFLLHPQFGEIFELLVAAVAEGVLGKLKISTNCVDPIPEFAKGRPGVTWATSPVRKKKHIPMVWSPKDMGIPTKGPCSMPFRCGFSLDAKGWLPCSAAIVIAPAFNMDHLYKKELPSEFWGHELCEHCVHSLPQSFSDEYFRTHKPLEKVEPTPSWRAALANYEEKEGIVKRRYSLPLVPA